MFWLWIIASVFTVDAAEDKSLQHPEMCNIFYSVGHCPPGEHFDANIGLCNLPQLANCKITGSETATFPTSESGYLLPVFPHPNSCEKYYRVNVCPEDFNFNPASNACDYPKSNGCPSGCAKLESIPNMILRPMRCGTENNKVGDVCQYECPKPLQVQGTTVLTCGKSGWENEGSYSTPECVSAVAVAEAMLSDLSQELENIDGGILFVMDESGSITAQNFKNEKTFIQAVIGRLPLSANRSAGVILFSDKVRVEVSFNTKDNCIFYKQVEDMKYRGGGTNIRLALEAAKKELLNAHSNKKAIVLLTDGQSPNAIGVAQELKDSGARIFTIGVTGHDAKALTAMASLNEANKKLFYAVSNKEAFDSIANYLESEYAENLAGTCTRKAENGLIARF